MPLSPLQRKKIDQIRELKTPGFKATKELVEMIVNEKLAQLPSSKPTPGYTPIKGKDYFTPTEIHSIISFIRSQIKETSKGDRGFPGAPGKDGSTPVRGVDYWTKEDQQKILREIEGYVAQFDKAPTLKEVIDEIKKHPIEYKEIKNVPDLTDMHKLIEFFKRGGFRGGGDTVAAGTNISITTTNGIKTISSSVTTVGFQVPTGTVNGVNQTFVFAQAPNVIVVDDGRPMRQISSDGTVNWTGTTTVVMTIAPNFDIYGLA